MIRIAAVQAFLFKNHMHTMLVQFTNSVQGKKEDFK